MVVVRSRFMLLLERSRFKMPVMFGHKLLAARAHIEPT
jgi:hypothetical protein